MYVSMYVMYVCMYVCMYIYIYICRHIRHIMIYIYIINIFTLNLAGDSTIKSAKTKKPGHGICFHSKDENLVM